MFSRKISVILLPLVAVPFNSFCDLEKNKDQQYVKRNVNGFNLSLKLINKSCPITNEKAYQVVKEYLKKEVNIKTESPRYPEAFEQAQTSCTSMLKDLVGYKSFWF